jgi:hypothetical protein
MSAHSQPSVGIDHPTVVPANFDPETDSDESGDAADDGRADR